MEPGTKTCGPIGGFILTHTPNAKKKTKKKRPLRCRERAAESSGASGHRVGAAEAGQGVVQVLTSRANPRVGWSVYILTSQVD